MTESTRDRFDPVSIGVNPGLDGIVQALDSLDSSGSRRDGP